MFRFTLVTTNNESLGVVAFARRDWEPGDLIPPNLRVVDVVDADAVEDGPGVGRLTVEPLER